MAKISQGWLNGILRAWDMLIEFSLSGFLKSRVGMKTGMASPEAILGGMPVCGFFLGFAVLVLAAVAGFFFGGHAAAVVFALIGVLFLELKDAGAGLAGVTFFLTGKLTGQTFGDLFDRLPAKPSQLHGGLESAVFTLLLLFKLITLYLLYRAGFGLFLSGCLVAQFSIQGLLASHNDAILRVSPDNGRFFFYLVAAILLVVAFFASTLALLLVVLTCFLIFPLFRKIEQPLAPAQITLAGAFSECIILFVLLLFTLGK